MTVPELPPMEEPKPGDGDSYFQYHDYLYYIWVLIAAAILLPLVFVYRARAQLDLIWIPILNMCITYGVLFFTIRAWRQKKYRRVYLGFAAVVTSLLVSASAYSILT
ncbi:hypothetical protein [Streptomyces sp. TRM68367]|uniref:hypothetical protein n=1 Tax=Streptomyces sp. TRM68367 TaxID=2758415 RepID=UPI00165C7604|nr:hypothetical protein [Streptomyces sp. TRM68367]MBC9723666.1 hypothetical protein [Streptomyces sp. TRM68367]